MGFAADNPRFAMVVAAFEPAGNAAHETGDFCCRENSRGKQRKNTVKGLREGIAASHKKQNPDYKTHYRGEVDSEIRCRIANGSLRWFACRTV